MAKETCFLLLGELEVFDDDADAETTEGDGVEEVLAVRESDFKGEDGTEGCRVWREDSCSRSVSEPEPSGGERGEGEGEAVRG